MSGWLLERDSQLETLASYWSDACAGDGRLVFVGGEAGSGKTALCREFGRLIAPGARLLVGICDSGSTPGPMGPLLDVANQLGMRASLDEQNVLRGCSFPKLRDALRRTPTLLIVEDAHWSDEATMDLLRYLGRRLEGSRVLIVVNIRDDEVMGNHPMASLMGELATTAQVRRLPVPLLTARAVAELAEAKGREADAAELYDHTKGNPFFVTEMLSSPAGTLPRTIRDAVTARTSRLSIPALEVLEAVAVIGISAEIALALSVSSQEATALDECVDAGMLHGHGPRVQFRHELARHATLGAIPPGRRADLHRRVLTELEAAGSTDHRRLTEHAVACADAMAVLQHASPAARRSARSGEHREAAAQWATVLAHGDSLNEEARAEVLENLSYQCSLVPQPEQALSARGEALLLHEALGDTPRVGVDQRWLSHLCWFVGRNGEAERYAFASVRTLEPLGASADLAMAYSNLSHLRMLNGDAVEALAWGRRARSAGAVTSNREAEAHALNTIGVALLRCGEEAEGRAALDEALAIALADGLEEQAARGYANIGAMQLNKRQLADAQQTLTAGITYCAERDLDQPSLHMHGWLAAVLIEHGRFDRGLTLANHVLSRPPLSATNHLTALLPAALVSLRVGEPALPYQLTQLGELAASAPDPLHLLSLALVHAEAAWTEGRRSDIVALTDPVWTASAGTFEPWILAELAWWRQVGGATEAVAFPLPEPFALMRDGRAREASTAWTALGRPFWSALALAAGSPRDAAESVATLLRIGAPATADAIRRDLAARGQPVPRGPRRAARENVAGLTARELDVLAFLVEGLSDAEIAQTLTLSERTVGHHVSAVLRKLGVPSRARAAVAAPTILPMR